MLDVLLILVGTIRVVIDYAAIAAVIVIIGLMVLRWVLLKVSPLGYLTYQVRQLTDPMLWPIAQNIPMHNRFDIAPLFVILVALLGAFFFKWVTNDVLRALEGVIVALQAVAFLKVLGWLLYGAVSVFLVLIIARIILSWMPFLREGRVMWILYSLTEPVMAPFRRMIPPLGMLDLSPMLLILLLNYAQWAVLRVFELQMMH